MAALFAATAGASTINTTNCHVSAHDSPASGTVACSGHYALSVRTCVQVRGRHGKWFVIKGDCSRASGTTPGRISASVPQFEEHCGRTYRGQLIGTAAGHRAFAYDRTFGLSCIG